MNTKDKEGRTPLINAVIDEQPSKLVLVLLENGAKINIQDKEGKTALMYSASASDKSDNVLILLLNGAKINMQDKMGYTALKYAVKNENNNIIKLLLYADAKVNLPSNIGVTPLMSAAYNNNHDIVKILLENGAKINLQTQFGDTVYNMARDGRGDEKIIQLLNMARDREFENREVKKKREEFKKKQGELKKTEKKRSKKLAKQKKIKNQCRDLIMQDDNNNDEWIKEDDRNFILKVGKSHICHNTDSIQKVINKNYFYECLKINNDIRGAYEPGEDFNNKIKYFKLYPNNELIKYDGDFFNKPLKTKHYILKKTGKKLIGIISSKLAPTVTESFIGKDHCQSGSSQIVYKIVPEKKNKKKIKTNKIVKKKQIGGNKKSIVTLGGIVLSIILLLFK